MGRLRKHIGRLEAAIGAIIVGAAIIGIANENSFKETDIEAGTRKVASYGLYSIILLDAYRRHIK